MPSPSERNRILLVTLLVQAINTWSMLAIAAVAPQVADQLGVGAVLVGYQIALIYGVAAVTSLFAGGWVARWGALRVCQTSLVTSALGVAMAASGDLLMIVVASMVIGVGYGIINPASSHLLFARTSPSDRSLVFSIKQTGVPLGGVLAGIVTPMLSLIMGWQFAVLAVMPLALILALAVQPLRSRWDADRSGKSVAALRIGQGALSIWSNPTLRALSMAAFMLAAIQLSLSGFVVAFAVTELTLGPVQAGSLLASVQVAGACSRLLLGWGADRLQDNGKILMLAGGLSVLGCIGFFLLTPTTPLVVVYAVTLLFGIGAIGWNGVFLAEVARQAEPGRIGAITGLAGVMTFAGVVVGPPLFVSLQQSFGSYGSAYLMFAFPALGSIAVVAWSRRSAQRTSE